MIRRERGLRVAQASRDTSWRTLVLVIDWIKHAEAKAAVNLAVVGVAATVLFNLVKNRHALSASVYFTAGACGAALVAAGVFAALALLPRRLGRGQESVLFYAAIAEKYDYPSDTAVYARDLRDVSASDDLLADDLARQILANSHVARRKYRLVAIALRFSLAGIVMLGVTVLLLEADLRAVL